MTAPTQPGPEPGISRDRMAALVAACGLSLTFGSFTLAAGCGGSAFSAGSDEPDGQAAASDDAAAVEGGAPEMSPETSPDTGPVGRDQEDDSGAPIVEAGPPQGWCSGQTHTFCADFDEQPSVTALLSSWSSFEQSGGSFDFDTTSALSPPNALEVKGASGAQTLVLETFPRLHARPTKIRLEFDLRIDSPGSVGAFSAAGFAAIAYGTGVADGYVALAIGNDFGNVLAGAWAIADGSAAGDAGSYATSSSGTAFPSSGTWAGRFAIEIDYDASGSACLQGYRGPTPLLTPCMPLPPSLSNPGVVSIALGDYAAGLGNTGAIDLEFDNVTYDVTP